MLVEQSELIQICRAARSDTSIWWHVEYIQPSVTRHLTFNYSQLIIPTEDSAVLVEESELIQTFRAAESDKSIWRHVEHVQPSLTRQPIFNHSELIGASDSVLEENKRLPTHPASVLHAYSASSGKVLGRQDVEIIVRGRQLVTESPYSRSTTSTPATRAGRLILGFSCNTVRTC